jgi:TRAP transporter TAXI family solute receptor
MRGLAVVLLLLAAGCSRGPDEAVLTKQVEEQIAKSFKPGLLELAGLKRQGSGPLPDGRVVVYYNATLRLKEGYDFKDWEGMSPATLAQALGARERGVIGVKAGAENRPGDLLRVYGTGIYERTPAGWKGVAGAQRDVAQAPAEPGSAAPATSSQRYLEQLASQVNLGPPGIDAASDKIISEELDHALRVIARRRARAQDITTVAAGPASGEYARVVEAVIGTLGKRRGKVRALAVETEGSIENAQLIGRGQADYALVQSDIAWLAFSGTGPFAVDGPLTRMTALGSLYPEPVHLVVPARSAIRSVEDLRGKRVDLGAPKSGSRINALAVLQAHRIAIGDLAEARGDGTQGAMQRMRVGELDAFFVTIGAPARELQRFAAANPVRLVPVGAAAAARMVEEQPALVRLSLPANTYPGQAEPVATVAATALLVGSADTPQDEVKAILELAFEGTDYLAFGAAQGVRIAKATGLRGIAIPLHPGAAAYFGKSKPEAKKP